MLQKAGLLIVKFLFLHSLIIVLGCYEADNLKELQFPPKLIEPEVNYKFQPSDKTILFRWQIDKDCEEYFTLDSTTILLDGTILTTLIPNVTMFNFTPEHPLHDGPHVWSVTVNTKENASFSAESRFFINDPPYIKDHSLDNLQAYIDDYLIVAIEFNEPMYGVALNDSIRIDKEATLSELETEDNVLYYFKIRNLQWDGSYTLLLDSNIKNGAGNPLKQTYLMIKTPREQPQPKAIGWIGGRKDGWHTKNGPFHGGTGDREFSDAQTISLSPNEDILYVCDGRRGNRIQKWTSSGIYMGWIGGTESGWHFGEAPEFELSGLALSIYDPSGAICDTFGNIYIMNFGYFCLSRWGEDGTYTGWLGLGKVGWQIPPINNDSGTNMVLRPWNFEYIQPSAYDGYGGYTDVEGNIYLLDHRNILVKISKEGDPIGWIGCGRDGWQTGLLPKSGCQGDVNPQMKYLQPDHGRFALDQRGNIYIGSSFHNWVVKWSRGGKALGWIGYGKNGWQDSIIDVIQEGHDLCSFSHPLHIAVDTVGNIFVTDAHNHRVSKWTKDGKAVGWIGHGKDGWQTGDAPEYHPDSDGKGNMEINRIPGAEGIAVDSHGTIYVSGTSSYGYNWRVSKWVMDDGEGGGGTPVEE